MNRSHDAGGYRRTHRTWVGPADMVIDTKFGQVGVWLSYRDQFLLQGIGEGTYGAPSKSYGKLRLGSSCVDVYAYVEPDGNGGYEVASLWGSRYFAPKHAWETHNADRLTRHQIAILTSQLTAIVSPVLAATSPGLIEAGHRRSIEADIRDERQALEFDLRTMREEIAKAQAHYDTLRSLERSIGAPATAVPSHLGPADDDLDAMLDNVDRLALGGPSLRALRSGAA